VKNPRFQKSPFYNGFLSRGCPFSRLLYDSLPLTSLYRGRFLAEEGLTLIKVKDRVFLPPHARMLLPLFTREVFSPVTSSQPTFITLPLDDRFPLPKLVEGFSSWCLLCSVAFPSVLLSPPASFGGMPTFLPFAADKASSLPEGFPGFSRNIGITSFYL